MSQVGISSATHVLFKHRRTLLRVSQCIHQPWGYRSEHGSIWLPRDCFPLSWKKKIALIMAGKFQTLKELWSGRVGSEGSGGYWLLPATYPPDPTDKHLKFPRLRGGFTWEQLRSSPGGPEGGCGGGFYGLLFSLCIALTQLPKRKCQPLLLQWMK